MSGGEERRRSRRAPILVYVRGLGEDRHFSEQIGDVGLGGVGFESAKRPAADVFRVSFSLPGESMLRTAYAGLVRTAERTFVSKSMHPWFIGAEFLDLREEDQRAIEQFLERTNKPEPTTRRALTSP